MHGQLPVAVDHSHLRTMASESADPIDWSYPIRVNCTMQMRTEKMSSNRDAIPGPSEH